MYLVSACLIGINCRYDGENNYNQRLYELFKKSLLYPVCPEILGGLEIPRNPCEVVIDDKNYKVYDIEGENRTDEFLKGAKKTLKIAKLLEVKGSIFKDKSPSCGVYYIYDGSFNENIIEGEGITTTVLKKADYKVYSEDDLDSLEI
ncbi:MAG: DUF523 domain-containing protein [Halanaerobiales bacterium]